MESWVGPGNEATMFALCPMCNSAGGYRLLKNKCLQEATIAILFSLEMRLR